MLKRQRDERPVYISDCAANLRIEVRHECGDLGWRYARGVDGHTERYHAGTIGAEAVHIVWTLCREFKPQLKLIAVAGGQRDEAPDETQREEIGSYLRDYYARWLDEPIPALGNKTPRKAVKT